MTMTLGDRSRPAEHSELVIRGGIKFDFPMALSDFREGFALWRLWTQLGWNDILQRYRRSILGPFWLTASMTIMVVALGVLYAELFQQKIDQFLPFFCLGILVWNLMAGYLTESGTLFTGSESYIK